MLGGEGDPAEGSAVKYCVRRLILVVKIDFASFLVVVTSS